MDFEALQDAWRSPGNTPDAAASAKIIREVEATLAARQARLRRLLVFAGVSLTPFLLLLGQAVISGRTDHVDLAREWGVAVFTLIPFVVLLLIAIRHLLVSRTSRASSTLLDGFKALRAENAAQRGRIHILAAAFAVLAPILMIVLRQMTRTGKMSPDEMVSAAIVLSGALALSASWMAIKYVAKLIPERRQLDALIQQYDVHSQ